MRKSLFLFLLALSLPAIGFAQLSESPSGIALDSAWKKGVYEFASTNLLHSAWGLEHYERNYNLAVTLAEAEDLAIDTDVLFAAAFLHDMGVFEPYVVENAEHSQTATETVEAVLQPLGFPMSKIGAVKAAILAHMFYASVPEQNEATVLHDADTLDFLGVIGVTRIVSLTNRHEWATDLSTAIETLENFSTQLPPSLVTKTAQRLGEQRVAEMNAFISTLKLQSSEGQAI